MVPFAVAGVEYGAVASRGSFARVVGALSSPDLETVGWAAAAIAIVVLATCRRGRLAFMLLLACGAALAGKVLDLW